jgi:hypothetical protein
MFKALPRLITALIIMAVGVALCWGGPANSKETLSPDNASLVSEKDEAADSAGTSKACPKDMVLAEGDYCRTAMYLCLKGTYVEKGETVFFEDKYGLPITDTMRCLQYKVGHAPCVNRPVRDKKTRRVIGHEPDVRHLSVCVDKFEFPNVVGEKPMVLVTFHEAELSCERQGKRLCGDDEWSFAAQGPDRLPYVTGWVREPSKCNVDKNWIEPNDTALYDEDPLVARAEVNRLWQGRNIGESLECRGPFGTYDQNGNVDEWVMNVDYKVDNQGRKYKKRLFKGGHWGKVRDNNYSVTLRHAHDGKFKYYAEGFRCCKTAEHDADYFPE